MVLYLANPGNARVNEKMASGDLGAIWTPKQGNKLPSEGAFCIDNGCGPGKDGQPGAGYPGDRQYLELLSKMSARAGRRCLFATAPDVLGDAEATLARSAPFVRKIRGWFGLPAALVAQDGLERLDVPWSWFDCLFLGGSTEWKLGPHAALLTEEAKARGKWVHMGRVNSFKRLRYAAYIGCDSADGTFLTFGPDKNLPRLLGWLGEIHEIPDQLALFGPEPAAIARPGTGGRWPGCGLGGRLDPGWSPEPAAAPAVALAA